MQELEQRKGYALGLTAYALWGVFPLYFKLLTQVPPLEVIAHRIIWGALFASIALLVWRHPHWLRDLLRHPLRFGALMTSGALIGATQLIYVWAVNHDLMIEASLGYYINPIVNVSLGYVLLRERLRPLQWVAVALAAIGVFQQIWQLGCIPWVSLSLALCFSFYGIIRKRTPVDALPGLMVENLLLAPMALTLLLVTRQAAGEPLALWKDADIGWLIGVGPVTLLPLLCFNAAARRLPYASLGFLQYITPTLVLLLAIYVFGEQLSTSTLTTFGFIWGGLLIYSLDIGLSLRQPAREESCG